MDRIISGSFLPRLASMLRPAPWLAKLQEAIIGELHHRVKNTLAIVSAITSQSLRTANSLEEASKTISERLHALGLAQDLLVRGHWTGADCRALIESAVKAFQSKSLDQLEITGDDVSITSGPALSLSMVLHELCTNAVKYGGLFGLNRSHFDFVDDLGR
jgi:two-component sensor histidine kinase